MSGWEARIFDDAEWVAVIRRRAEESLSWRPHRSVVLRLLAILDSAPDDPGVADIAGHACGQCRRASNADGRVVIHRREVGR